MPDKLYNADYLKETAMLLQQLKEQSYAPFMAVKNGRISDIGCGVGTDAINLGELLKGNNVKVIGVDSDEEMIGQATDAGKQSKNVAFIVADSESLPFEDGNLSGIRNERLIQHLAHPDVAFNEFYRVLKTDAPIALVETDWTSLSFYNGSYELTQKVKEYFWGAIAKNSYAAINLSHFLETHGFREISLNIFPIISHSLDQVAALTKINYILNKMQRDGCLSESEFKGYWHSLEKANREHSFVCAINLVLAIALK